MKKRYALTLGYVMFIASIMWLLFLFSVIIDNDFYNDTQTILIILSTGLISLINIIFFIKVKFWQLNRDEYYKLEQQNLIIKKKIEQKELENKLTSLEK